MNPSPAANSNWRRIGSEIGGEEFRLRKDEDKEGEKDQTDVAASTALRLKNDYRGQTATYISVIRMYVCILPYACRLALPNPPVSRIEAEKFIGTISASASSPLIDL